MARAGHTRYETTKRYIQLAGQVFEDEAEALAAFRLGLLQSGRSKPWRTKARSFSSDPFALRALASAGVLVC
jgi:hypothetical protein